jgi:hypothetical protein
MICNIPYDPSIKFKFINNKLESNLDDMLKNLKNSNSLRNDSKLQLQLNNSSSRPQFVNNSGPMMNKIIISGTRNLLTQKALTWL